ncbi:MAG: hypothetical protein ABI622_02740 [Chloroflexota bacterium]
MPDEMTTILRLVAEGTLSPEEAAPIIDALSRVAGPRPPDPPPVTSASGRRVRIRVSEKGRHVVDVRVPLGLASMAARMVPGIPERYANLITEAAESRTIGTIVDAEDEQGDGVLITLE